MTRTLRFGIAPHTQHVCTGYACTKHVFARTCWRMRRSSAGMYSGWVLLSSTSWLHGVRTVMYGAHVDMYGAHGDMGHHCTWQQERLWSVTCLIHLITR